MFPSLYLAATEAAVMGYGVLFYHTNPDGESLVGVIWYEGHVRFTRGLRWRV